MNVACGIAVYLAISWHHYTLSPCAYVLLALVRGRCKEIGTGPVSRDFFFFLFLSFFSFSLSHWNPDGTDRNIRARRLLLTMPLKTYKIILSSCNKGASQGQCKTHCGVFRLSALIIKMAIISPFLRKSARFRILVSSLLPPTRPTNLSAIACLLLM